MNVVLFRQLLEYSLQNEDVYNSLKTKYPEFYEPIEKSIHEIYVNDSVALLQFIDIKKLNVYDAAYCGAVKCVLWLEKRTKLNDYVVDKIMTIWIKNRFFKQILDFFLSTKTKYNTSFWTCLHDIPDDDDEMIDKMVRTRTNIPKYERFQLIERKKEYLINPLTTTEIISSLCVEMINNPIPHHRDIEKIKKITSVSNILETKIISLYFDQDHNVDKTIMALIFLHYNYKKYHHPLTDVANHASKAFYSDDIVSFVFLSLEYYDVPEKIWVDCDVGNTSNYEFREYYLLCVDEDYDFMMDFIQTMGRHPCMDELKKNHKLLDFVIH